MHLSDEICFEVFLRRTDFRVQLFVIDIHKNQVKSFWLCCLNIFVNVTDFRFELCVRVEAEVVNCYFHHLGIDVD